MREKRDGLGRPIDRDAFYYIQDSRQYVGNCVLWWAVEGQGYTCELPEAGMFKGSDSRVHSDRDCDVPWPVELVRPFVRQHIDASSLHRLREQATPPR